jgi:alcohol dehydrogenase class IV
MAASQDHPADSDGEVYRPAFPSGYPHISYGLSFPETCVKHVTKTFNASRVYIIASASLSRNTDYVKQLHHALGDKVVGTRYGMKPHTLWSEILEITNETTELKADLLITLGAGSLTDGAKVIALVRRFAPVHGDLADLFQAIANKALTFSELDALHAGDDWLRQRPDLNPPTIPIISIPTSLSGGEYSFLGGATNDKTHLKHGFGHPTRGPALVVLDPKLTTTTPPSIWLQSGVRAIDHCVEGLCSLSSTPASDEAAEKGLRRLAPGLLRCHSNPSDVDARLECQMGVIDAMAVVFQHGVPMGASHGIGHQLGPLGVGHGETSCVLLPAVCKYNVGVNGDRQEKVKKVLWAEREVAETLRRKGVDESAELGVVLDILIRELEMPRSLKDVGVGEDKMDVLAENSLRDRWCGTNPRPLKNKKDVLEILEMVRG